MESGSIPQRSETWAILRWNHGCVISARISPSCLSLMESAAVCVHMHARVRVHACTQGLVECCAGTR